MQDLSIAYLAVDFELLVLALGFDDEERMVKEEELEVRVVALRALQWALVHEFSILIEQSEILYESDMSAMYEDSYTRRA